jgi:DNA-binding response OmpR family regulator
MQKAEGRRRRQKAENSMEKAEAAEHILVVDDDRGTALILKKTLNSAGYATTVAHDGVQALKALGGRRFDLILLDVWMPRKNGLELLAEMRAQKSLARVIVMTTDDAPETVLKAVRDQAIRYVHKPFEPQALLQTVREVLAAPEPQPIDVVSAKPEWVELVVPCSHEAAERIQGVMAQLDAKLDPRMRDQLAMVFRELLMNAIEWGGRLDPNRTVRIACLRTPRMLMYRIADPGPGFNVENLAHAAIGQSSDNPIAHMQVREEKGIRPGGFGLLMVREAADELIYNEKRNEVVFVKYLTS